MADYLDTYVDANCGELAAAATWFTTGLPNAVEDALDHLYKARNIANSAWEGEAADNFRATLRSLVDSVEGIGTSSPKIGNEINMFISAVNNADLNGNNLLSAASTSEEVVVKGTRVLKKIGEDENQDFEKLMEQAKTIFKNYNDANDLLVEAVKTEVRGLSELANNLGEVISSEEFQNVNSEVNKIADKDVDPVAKAGEKAAETMEGPNPKTGKTGKAYKNFQNELENINKEIIEVDKDFQKIVSNAGLKNIWYTEEFSSYLNKLDGLKASEVALVESFTKWSTRMERIGKASKIVGGGANVLFIATSAIEVVDIFRKEGILAAADKTGETIASGIGAAAGAEAGAELGFVIGSIVPGVGNTAGTVVGAGIGALVGAVSGSEMGEGFYSGVKNFIGKLF